MFSYQARAARAILRLGVREVAAEIGVAPNTVSRFEAGPRELKEWRPHRVTENALKAFYESKGIRFTASGIEVQQLELDFGTLRDQIEKEKQA